MPAHRAPFLFRPWFRAVSLAVSSTTGPGALRTTHGPVPARPFAPIARRRRTSGRTLAFEPSRAPSPATPPPSRVAHLVLSRRVWLLGRPRCPFPGQSLASSPRCSLAGLVQACRYVHHNRLHEGVTTGGRTMCLRRRVRYDSPTIRSSGRSGGARSLVCLAAGRWLTGRREPSQRWEGIWSRISPAHPALRDVYAWREG